MSLLLDNVLQFCSELGVYRLMGVKNMATSSDCPNGNNVEHVDHIMEQIFSMVINERPKYLDGHSLH